MGGGGVVGGLHESRPLRHLAEVAVGVVEELDGGDVGVWGDGKGALEACLVPEDAVRERECVCECE